MATALSLKQLYENFTRFESHLEGFEIDGVPVWEAIRARIFAKSAMRADLFGVGHPFVPRSLKNIFRTGVNIAKSMTTHNSWRLPEADLLVLGHPRLVKDQEGRFEDPYSEAYLRSIDLRSVFLEKPFRCRHYHPRVAGCKSWIDHALMKSRCKVHLKSDSLNKAKELETLFRNEMGMEFDLTHEIEDVLGTRTVMLPFFNKIIRRVKPRIAIVVVAYTSPFFIEACKQNQIPVIEIQHGMFSRYHLGYDYSAITPQLYFPDHVWLWGRYWRDAANLPKRCQYKEVGWPLFEDHRENTQQSKEPDCLFISQGSVGKKIAEEALQLRRDRPEIKIYFKLHPSEYQTWQQEYPELLKAGIQVLTAEDGGIYDWLAKIRYVVGGYSTVLAEAIGMGCRVGVLNVPGREYMERLVERKAAYWIKDGWGEFFDGNECQDTQVAMDVFQPFKYEYVEKLLQEMI